MALPVIESDRLDMAETVQRPSEAGRRVLPSAKENECAFIGHVPF